MKDKTIEDLNSLYADAELADKPIFAEQRSNILLVAGEHYSNKARSFYARQRDTRDQESQQKLRITKNHCYRISRHYKTNLSSYVPGVTVKPKNEMELQDQKIAELNLAVWQDAKIKYRLREFFRELTSDFVDIGELCYKVYWDPNKGDFLGYSQAMSDAGEPEVDETGEPVADESSPVFSGDFCWERIWGYNLKRHPGCKVMRESACWIIDKFSDVGVLKRQYANDSSKLGFIQNASEEEFVIFDSNKTTYSKSKKGSQVLVKEFYYQPSAEYPMGYYYYTCGNGILEQGELPFGIWPLVWAGFDVYPGSPRGRSPIKVARPWQAEINRASSSVALHQTTLGDDKILYQNGTKLAPGALLPGVRGITFQGAPPTVLPGRDGSQYTQYIDAQVSELDKALMIVEVEMENQTNLDPHTLLYRAMSQRKKFSPYCEKLEQAFIDGCEIYLKLAKEYLPDDALIRAAGRGEYINIAEFKSSTLLRDSIVLEPQEEQIETRLGRQLNFNHILQYVGPNLPEDVVGKILQLSPFASDKEAFADLTIDYDSVRNEFLAIERGEDVQVNPNDNHEYALSQYSSRMKRSDYKVLPPEIQQLYEAKRQEHDQYEQERQAGIAAAKNEFVPIGGALIAADMYVPNKEDPSKLPKRVRIPYQALEWLVETLEKQGMSLEKLEAMNNSSLTELARNLSNGQGQPGQVSQMEAPDQFGAASPQGDYQ